MIQGLRVLGWIPARGGSKGIKDKNIRPLCEKPLIAYTVEAARKSVYIDTVMVSTDSMRIADVAKAHGAWVPELRPAELAKDTSKTLDAVLYSLKYLEECGQTYDIFCLLQPTSPLRTARDIDGALEIFSEAAGELDVVGVSESRSHPVLMRSIREDGRLTNLLDRESTVRRQDMPVYYEVNGSIYVNAVSRINTETSFNDNPLPYIMDMSHGIDIDEMADLYLAEYYLTQEAVCRGE